MDRREKWRVFWIVAAVMAAEGWILWMMFSRWL
jgi:hypothetical protein